MNEREVSEAVAEWIGVELGIPEQARYPYPVANTTGPLTTTQPDVAALADRKRTMLAQAARAIFPYGVVEQQALFRVFDVSATVGLAVEDDDHPDTEQTAREVFQRLQSYGEKLEVSALKDATLGGRVAMISPAQTYDYSEVFAERDDGTRSRLMACEFTVGEPIEFEADL